MTISDPSKCLIINPIDYTMLFVTLIIISVKLRFYKDNSYSFEDTTDIFVVVCLTILKIYGIVYDMISIGVFEEHIEPTIQFTGLNTEIMLLKNYETNQMIVTYLFVICGAIVTLNKLRERTTIHLTNVGSNINPVAPKRKPICTIRDSQYVVNETDGEATNQTHSV
uniref:Serpentine receptor class gamma n=1 Tax=Caenorhabditis tropicalis TaxID=1561998 RepID=A0A1I7TXX2_9PELO